VNVGHGFRPPACGELYLDQGLFMPNSELRPERATFCDAGVVAAGRWGRMAVSGFVTSYQDLILYELFLPMRAKPYNFGRAVVAGGELELGTTLGPFSAQAAYTLAHSTNRTDDPRYLGKELPYHPRHRAHARAALELGLVETHAELDVQSRQLTNRTNTDELAGRARLDAGASVLLSGRSGIRLQVDVKNVLDSAELDLYGPPLAGRSFHVGVHVEPPSSPRSTR